MSELHIYKQAEVDAIAERAHIAGLREAMEIARNVSPNKDATGDRIQYHILARITELTKEKP